MLELQYFKQDDFEQLINWIKDEALLINWCGSLFNYPLTHKSLDWYIQDVNDLATSDAFVYKAVDTATGLTVGHISLGGVSRKNRSARISRVLIGDTARGKGCCQGMVKAILKIGFEDLKLHRIELGVYAFNTAAIACYKKTGFTIEGIRRDVLLHAGEWWSLVEMSILETEWNANQTAINHSVIL